jgi:hypothetical protein
MSLLTMANGVQDRLGLPRSTVVVSSTDQNVRRLLALANQEGKELAKRHTWQAITKEKTFTSLAQASQTSAIPSDFDRFVNESMFNRTNHRRVLGPLSPEQWQAQQALSASLLVDAFRVRGNAIYINPTPAAGLTYAFEYVSTLWIDSDSDGDGDLAAWTHDTTNSGLLSEDLMGLGIDWRYLKAIGLDYAEAFRTYELQVEQAIIRDGGARTLSFAGGNSPYGQPGVGVPEGSWDL